MTPDSMKPHLKKMHLLDKYDLERPKGHAPPQRVEEYAKVGEILTSSSFATPYESRAARIIKGTGYVSTLSLRVTVRLTFALVSSLPRRKRRRKIK